MRILAYYNIPYVEAAFGHLGEVRAVPSSAIDAAAAREADLLLVRSTVRVGAALLEGSAVRFVGSAVAGTDHVDTAWLADRGIAFASAPGSNAPSVAQWFASALLVTAGRRNGTVAGLTAGIVGVGQVGSRIERVCRALGCEVLRCDPPRARVEGPEGFVGLDELCSRADVVTLHVPLVDDGPDRTRSLIDARRLASLRPGAWLVNAARGPVVVSDAAIEARRSGQLGALLLDVYEGEPAPSPALVEIADLATAHIAGHSLDGKAAGTEIVYRAACDFLGVKPAWTARRSLPPLPMAALSLDARDLDDEAAALRVVSRFYRIEDDDAALRRVIRLPEGERRRAFQRLRDEYGPRREPIGLRVELRPVRHRALALIEALGARPEQPG